MKKRRGFISALVLIFLMVASIMLLTLYQLVANYRTNAIRMHTASQLDVDALNTLNAGIGYIRLLSAGVLGFNITYQNQTPQWYSDFHAKLSSDWKNFVSTNVLSNNTYVIADISTNSQYCVDNTLKSEIVSYLTVRNLSSVSISALKTNLPLSAFIVSRVEKNGIVTYAYGIVTSKLLNQYVYFTNRETGVGGTTIYFKAGEIIDGPMRSHDYININNAGGKPTFTSTIEVLGIKNQSGQIVQPANYSSFANLLGNPPYRLLTNQDISALDFNAIKNEYRTAINNFVRDYNTIKANPSSMSGIKFTGNVNVSFNHGQGGNSYDVKISQGNVDYIITWNPSPPDAILRRQGAGQPETTIIKFNGIIYATGNITVDGPTRLSTYKGNFTLFSERDVVLNDRIIPYNTYTNHFTANEHGNNGDPVNQTKLQQIKEFVNSNETSSLNLVAINNVRIGVQPGNTLIDDMKIFASIFAFDGSFQADAYNTASAAGQLFVFGSIMQNYRGPVGTFNPSTGQTTTGYYKTYSYDPRIITGAFLPYGTPTKSQTVSLKVLGLAK
ncbi:hypothetical protein [Fervidobacterium sp.]